MSMDYIFLKVKKVGEEIDDDRGNKPILAAKKAKYGTVVSMAVPTDEPVAP